MKVVVLVYQRGGLAPGDGFPLSFVLERSVLLPVSCRQSRPSVSGGACFLPHHKIIAASKVNSTQQFVLTNKTHHHSLSVKFPYSSVYRHQVALENHEKESTSEYWTRSGFYTRAVNWKRDCSCTRLEPILSRGCSRRIVPALHS